MNLKNSKLDKIIDKLCEGKNKEYKTFIRKMIYAMNDEINGKNYLNSKTTNQLKKKNISMITLA